MTVLLQVSDTHFGTERPVVVKALVRLARTQAPDVVVLSGDITQRARPAQFVAARSFMQSLRVPKTLVIPGNHDIPLFNLPARLFRPYGNYQRVFGDALEATFEAEDLLVLTVNTTSRWRHKNGVVSRAQIERVARRIEHAGTSQVRVVVTHQPLAVTKPEDRENLLRGHEAAARAWCDAGVDLVLGGHIHLPFIVAVHRRYDDMPNTLWAVQAGTAVSSRIRKGADNSVNFIKPAGLLNGRRCIVVERWDFIEASQRFECVTSDELHVHPRTQPTVQ
ncbi:metallophosphoesterase family protein [Rhizobacter sp. LjRoot28]|uniref:metallophosphoesterase family protein n=1 Tax=Rhizobacter sp. LjRoot28 TaxID=3342309 RepID=UPI003ED12E54